MEINLVRNDEIMIDQEILDGINRNAIVFNMDEDSLNYINRNYEERNELPLIPYGVTRQVYELIFDTERVGIIVLSLEEDPEHGKVWEAIILVFGRFQRQGFSKQSLKGLIKQNIELPLRVTIHQENNARTGLENILSELGFIVIQRNKEYVTLLRK